MRLNQVQKMYVRMYRSRNAFVHGNPVEADQIFMGKTHTDSLFVKVAPLVYQAALESTLIRQRRPKFTSRRQRLVYVFQHAHLERALQITKQRRL